jgi:MATE family multidrug resistance protein
LRFPFCGFSILSGPSLKSHPFEQAPRRTLFRLSIPVLFSLVAEPITGLVDTAFVARLGAVELAALGVGTMALSSVFWIFNFLGVATQTDVARADGRGDTLSRGAITGLSMMLSLLIGVGSALVLWPFITQVTGLLGAADAIQGAADRYMSVRLWGSPAILVTIAGFGALRGIQRMQIPLWIAVGVNVLNIVLDAILIFGFGPLPAFGIEGAAAATAISQWVGAISTWLVVRRVMGARLIWDAERARHLFRVGWDLFLRTGALTLFLLVGTREATRLGAEAGAAHQAIRQFWLFTALFLDAFAIAGQSLVAFFAGNDRLAAARRVARTIMEFCFGFGVFLLVVMWLGEDLIARLLVPESALIAFGSAWWLALLFQPLNALAFGTDGVHWGTGDFAFLRNATIVATAVGIALLYAIGAWVGLSLPLIWAVTGVWIGVRVLFGVGRVWPGSSKAPLGRYSEQGREPRG